MYIVVMERNSVIYDSNGRLMGAGGGGRGKEENVNRQLT